MATDDSNQANDELPHFGSDDKTYAEEAAEQAVALEMDIYDALIHENDD